MTKTTHPKQAPRRGSRRHLAVLGVCGLLTGGICVGGLLPQTALAQETGTEAGRKLIVERYRDALLGKSLPDIEQIKGWVATLDANGQWPDIDYTDKTIADWKVKDHLGRLGQMSRALVDPKSPLYNDDALKAAVFRGLGHWNAKRYQNSNWWHNDIGDPMLMRDIIVALGDKLTGDLRTGALAVINQYGRPRAGDGANTVWEAELQLEYGALTGNDALIDSASKLIAGEIHIGKGEGLQSDFSFHQHRTRLQQFHYGGAYLSDSARLAGELNGTPWALPPEKVALLGSMLLEGSQWMMRGAPAPGTLDRSISRPGAMGKVNLTATVGFLREALPARAAELDAILARQNGTAAPLVGFRAFPRSDFTAFHRPAFAFFLKTLSDRTLPTEAGGNHEHLKGQLMSSGDHYLQRTGTEYTGLPPVWDWKLLPGVTFATGAGVVQRQLFVGAVGDSVRGATAMDYRLGTKEGQTLSARKFWACDGDVIVALIGDLKTQTLTAPVRTALDQSLLSGPVTVADDTGKTRTLDSGTYDALKLRWIQHNSLAYLPLYAQPVSLRLGPVTGSWRSINQSGPEAPVTLPVFLPILEQGNAPKEQRSGYVLAASATPQSAAQLAAHPTWRILRNDADCQAVTFTDGTTMAAFYAPGKVEQNGKTLLEVDTPCLIQEHAGTLIVCDPTQKGGIVTIHSGSGKAVSVTLPAGGIAAQVANFGK